ncbi:hypothetical protein OAM41_02955 [Gammaproteobacteria bacterium]|nr:hypothetical protein [Gammaproteobacteria bacterium]
MASRYFPKPQPLSPKTLTWVENDVRYIKDSRVRGGKRRVKGVWTTDSIYYLWFEYLKRNAEYKKVCEGKSKKMKKIYKDFGNVFEYKGVEGFWEWWKERGQFLFSVKPLSNIDSFFNISDVADYENEIVKGEILLLPIPTLGSKELIKKSANKLIDSVDFYKDKQHKAKYEVATAKVDVKGLKKALLAYDLYKQQKDILEIGLIVSGFDKSEFDDWLADGRKKQTEFGVEEWIDWCDNNLQEYGRILEKANKAVYKRIGDKFVDADKLDDLIDAEMRRLKTDYVRTSKKKSIRTYTHKLLNKAKANIEAVGKGTFGKGIYQL